MKYLLKAFCILILNISFIFYSKAQQQQPDTLQNVTVTAFALQSKWKDVPAAVAVVNKQQLQLLNNTSLVPVLNTVAGVRMEERSPGSYRFSIRGSLLRSPFGVRNVKIYWNGIPLTDAGGNTYLQLVDINQLNSVEVIKGPASSLYGANTGGALVLHSGDDKAAKTNAFNAGLSGGSYGLFNEQAGWRYSKQNFIMGIQQSHQQNDGYRQQSALRRDAVKWDGKLNISNKETLSFLTFYSNLHYETPGGITQHQMDSIPTLARQPTPFLPGAVQQHAGVYNKTIFCGVSLVSNFSSHFTNTTTLTANHTDFKNPFITNYEKRRENNYGGRTTFTYQLVDKSNTSLKWLAGAEWLQNHSHINDYGNRSGVADTIQSLNELIATQYFYYTQLNLQLAKKFTLQTGVSLNKQLFKYRRLDKGDKVYNNKDAGNQWAPRVSLLYNIGSNVGFYAVAAKGFSSPTLAEIFPSSGKYYGDLRAEYGWNYEAGFKGALFNNVLLYDASVYYFKLKSAIVQRTDSTGSAYFINAGGTKQQGVEVWLKVNLIHCDCAFINYLSVANSFTYQPYKFTDYITGTNNFNGNKLTGVPRNVNVATLEAGTKAGLYANVIYNHTSKIPLNDANTVYAKHYNLLQAKLGFNKKLASLQYNLYAGVDNLLNELYSLGNDLNAAGNRYFNPSPKRNFYAGIQLIF